MSMTKKKLIDFLTVSYHYHIQDEGGSPSAFRSGLNQMPMRRLLEIKKYGL